MNEQLLSIIAKQLQLSIPRVKKVIELFIEGATIPFIARYRKEMTGEMDEVLLEQLDKAWKKGEELVKRKAFILDTIEEQGKLSAKLKAQIESCWDATLLEDLYLPYKQKRKTRATKGKELGLEPLAQLLFDQREQQVESACRPYVKGAVKNIEQALQGARDIIAEWLSEDQQLRGALRAAFERHATIDAKPARGKKEAADKYRDYFDFSERLDRCPSHRLLALFRGEQEGLLKLTIGPDPERSMEGLANMVCKGRGPSTDQVYQALEDAHKRLLQPSISTEFRKLAKEKADVEAIEVFTNNLRQLLLAPPLGERAILGIDPGFRSGCKVVALDQQGNLKQNTAIYPHPPQQQKKEAGEKVVRLIRQYNIEAIAIGNGTAGRETLDFIEALNLPKEISVFMVNESGASIYSASPIAREEFPDHDITVRGAVSIGRRLMDPLAELVKIDPKSIGVGQYQHDVQQTMLKESLDRTVESCVNRVGINLNTASKHLLTYVSGLGPTLAQNIVEYRESEGAFASRAQLKKVPRLGNKAFEQCAGFLRIRSPKNLLDNTAVHPERYALVKQMAKDLNTSVEALIEDVNLRKGIELSKYVKDDIGLPTLRDIVEELAKPGLDPRGAARAFSFDRSIKSMDDLKPGMRLPGIVTNVTNFGAFVDIGVKQDGLVHISQLADTYVKNPADHVSLNQEVMVRIIEVDAKRGRINLSMKQG